MRLPLYMSELIALFDHVADALEREGCDETLRHSEAFLRARGLDVDRVVAWLRRSGGYCDCEVLMNVERR